MQQSVVTGDTAHAYHRSNPCRYAIENPVVLRAIPHKSPHYIASLWFSSLASTPHTDDTGLVLRSLTARHHPLCTPVVSTRVRACVSQHMYVVGCVCCICPTYRLPNMMVELQQEPYKFLLIPSITLVTHKHVNSNADTNSRI